MAAIEAAARRPMRQAHTPEPFMQINPSRVAHDAAFVRAEVMASHRRWGAGAYLFVSPSLQVFVISELRSVAMPWLAEHTGWLVGFYVPCRPEGRRKYVPVPLAVITDDLEQHLADLLRLKQSQ